MSDLDFLAADKPQSEGDSRGLSPGSIMLIVGMLAFVGVIALQLTRQNQTQPMPGQAAPLFELTSFDGETLSLLDLRGQIVIVNFWGSWCVPCHAEAPDFQAIHEDFAELGVVIIGVNWLDVEREALAFLDDYGLTYANGPDIAERIAETYHIQGAPETFIIGRDGMVTHSILGPVDYDGLARRLNEILAGESSA